MVKHQKGEGKLLFCSFREETVSYMTKNRLVCFGIEVSVRASTIENEVKAFDTCGLVVIEKLCESSRVVLVG